MKYRILLQWLFLLLCIAFCLSARAEERGRIVLSVREAAQGQVLCISGGAEEIPEGRPVALLLFLHMAEGVTCTSASPEMTLTVKHSAEGRVTRILLDGPLPPPDGEGSILLLCFDGPVEIVSATLYRIAEDGRVETCPPLSVVVEKESLDATREDDVAEQVTATESISIPEGTDPVSSSPPESEKSPETHPAPDTALVPAQYVGCRETAVTDGAYDVQLLFADTVNVAAPTPATVCLGGGTLRLEIGRTCIGGVFYRTVTYRSLSVTGRYRFLIYTPEGVVESVYGNGRFLYHEYHEKTPRGAFFQL